MCNPWGSAHRYSWFAVVPDSAQERAGDVAIVAANSPSGDTDHAQHRRREQRLHDRGIQQLDRRNSSVSNAKPNSPPCATTTPVRKDLNQLPVAGLGRERHHGLPLQCHHAGRGSP